ncbi:MAG: class I SAM-dependent rRNA methyltransferase [Alphaproteobacteria bacterium]|nr:class I SAM-dependent rRNA methyltransferase [Alphaproteobacteria bacterium]
MINNSNDRLKIFVHKKFLKRILSGHPWIYSNEIVTDHKNRLIPSGSVVGVYQSNEQFICWAIYNPHTLIAARILSYDYSIKIDVNFFAHHFKNALALREKIFTEPYYRLIHAEADNCPGLIIDRYDNILVVQINISGMDLLWPIVEEALVKILKPKTIVLRNDSTARTKEGLPLEIKQLYTPITEPLQIIENDLYFFMDPIQGQKTGWFYDHRDNRLMIAKLSKNKSVLDCYCHSGGFSINALARGAHFVMAIDRSEHALKLAQMSLHANNLKNDSCQFILGDVMDELQNLISQNKKFDIIVLDPPAFIKNKKDIPQGSRAYRKLAKLAAQLVNPQGFLFFASCSYHMDVQNFSKQIASAIHSIGRKAQIIAKTSTAADHPLHPFLQENDYLKAQLIYFPK